MIYGHSSFIVIPHAAMKVIYDPHHIPVIHPAMNIIYKLWQFLLGIYWGDRMGVPWTY
jgi:hypothetical protein